MDHGTPKLGDPILLDRRIFPLGPVVAHAQSIVLVYWPICRTIAFIKSYSLACIPFSRTPAKTERIFDPYFNEGQYKKWFPYMHYGYGGKEPSA